MALKPVTAALPAQRLAARALSGVPPTPAKKPAAKQNLALGPALPAGQVSDYGYTGGSWRYPVANTGYIADYSLNPNTPPVYTNPVTGEATTQHPSAPVDQGGGGGPQDFGDDFNPRNWALGEYMSDPRYGDASKLFSARTTAARGALRNALRSAVISGGWGDLNLGANPALSGYAGDIDQDTLSAAAANPMSQRAQLQGQLDKAQADIPWRLTSRGAAESGAAGVAAQTNQDQFKSASYNAMQDLLGGLQGNLSSYGQDTAAAEGTFNSSVNDLINSLANMAAGQHAATNARGYNLPAEQQPVYTPPGTPKATVASGTGTPSAKTVASVKKVQAAKQKAALPAQRNAALALSGVLGTRY